ncbi:MAG: PASTA domain-containing protein, partial [Erysipelotrichaceae bacterium]|nr:PASTA domain-containing protein [Erysipelotrichaceae bacterium]
MKRFFSNSMNIILTISLAAILFIIIYLGINFLDLGKQDIIVPDFSTMNVEEAKRWFADNNLTDKQYVIDYEYDDEVKEGKLIYQSIKADEKLTSAIRLVYSKGVDPKKADLIEVPDFNNLSEDEIKKWANDNNINLSIEYNFSDTVEKGKVIEANVEKGSTINKDKIIMIVLSKGKESSDQEVVVKDSYIGYSEDNFVRSIEELGLKVSKQSQTYESTKYSTGSVYAYDSTSDGITFKKGDTVRYWLVKNNDTSSETVTVPDSYIGYSEADFIKAIETLGLKASKQSKTYTSKKYSTGSVYAYDSTSDGITFKKGDTVKYYLVNNGESIETEINVPDSYIGYTEANFIKAIEALGLKASKQSQTYTSSKYQTGTVYAYDSTSDGITFKKGDTVKYWLVKNND